MLSDFDKCLDDLENTIQELKECGFQMNESNEKSLSELNELKSRIAKPKEDERDKIKKRYSINYDKWSTIDEDLEVTLVDQNKRKSEDKISSQDVSPASVNKETTESSVNIFDENSSTYKELKSHFSREVTEIEECLKQKRKIPIEIVNNLLELISIENNEPSLYILLSWMSDINDEFYQEIEGRIDQVVDVFIDGFQRRRYSLVTACSRVLRKFFKKSSLKVIKSIEGKLDEKSLVDAFGTKWVLSMSLLPSEICQFLEEIITEDKNVIKWSNKFLLFRHEVHQDFYPLVLFLSTQPFYIEPENHCIKCLHDKLIESDLSEIVLSLLTNVLTISKSKDSLFESPFLNQIANKVLDEKYKYDRNAVYRFIAKFPKDKMPQLGISGLILDFLSMDVDNINPLLQIIVKTTPSPLVYNLITSKIDSLTAKILSCLTHHANDESLLANACLFISMIAKEVPEETLASMTPLIEKLIQIIKSLSKFNSPSVAKNAAIACASLCKNEANLAKVRSLNGIELLYQVGPDVLKK